MAYTDMTSYWAYKKLILWKDLDIHAENSADAKDYFEDMFFWVTHQNSPAAVAKNAWAKMNFAVVVTNPYNTWNNTTKIWTPGKIGKYLVTLTGSIQTGDYVSNRVALYKNGSIQYCGARVGSVDTGVVTRMGWSQLTRVINVTSTTDYYEPYCMWLGSAEDPPNSANFQDGTAVNPQFAAVRIH